MLGAIAQHYVATVYQTPTRVGAIQGGSAAAATSNATSFAQITTAGNTSIVAWGGLRTSVTEPTITLTGYTLIGKVWGTRTGLGEGVWIYAKACAGIDSAPTINYNGASVSTVWTTSEWSGLDNAALGLTTPVSTTNTANTDPSTNYTSTYSNELVFAGLGARAGSGGLPVPTWTNATAEYNTVSGRSSSFYSAKTLITAGGSVNVSADINNLQGDPINVLLTVGFKAAAV